MPFGIKIDDARCDTLADEQMMELVAQGDTQALAVDGRYLVGLGFENTRGIRHVVYESGQS